MGKLMVPRKKWQIGVSFFFLFSKSLHHGRNDEISRAMNHPPSSSRLVIPPSDQKIGFCCRCKKRGKDRKRLASLCKRFRVPMFSFFFTREHRGLRAMPFLLFFAVKVTNHFVTLALEGTKNRQVRCDNVCHMIS